MSFPKSQKSSNQTKALTERVSDTYKSTLHFNSFDWTKDTQYAQKKSLKTIIEITKDMKPIGKKVQSEQRPDYLKTDQELKKDTKEKQSCVYLKRHINNGKTFQRIFGEDYKQNQKPISKKVKVEERNFQQLIGGYPKEKEQPKKQEVQNVNSQFQTLQRKFAEGITFIAKKKLDKTPQHHFGNLKGYEMISDIFHTGFNQPSQIPFYKSKDDCVLPSKGKFKERRLKSQTPQERKREMLSCTSFQQINYESVPTTPRNDLETKRKIDPKDYNYSDLFGRVFSKNQNLYTPKVQCLYGMD